MNTRRDFLIQAGKLTSGAALGYFTLPLLTSCLPTSAPMVPPPESVPIGADGTVTVSTTSLTSGSAAVAPNVVGLDGFGVILTMPESGTVKAFSMKCTHQSCAVDNRLAGSDIHCSCHGSLFDLNGNVVTGPATTNLLNYPVQYDAASHTAKIQLRS